MLGAAAGDGGRVVGVGLDISGSEGRAAAAVWVSLD